MASQTIKNYYSSIVMERQRGEREKDDEVAKNATVAKWKQGPKCVM
jgi:hypothetical protein